MAAMDGRHRHRVVQEQTEREGRDGRVSRAAGHGHGAAWRSRAG